MADLSHWDFAEAFTGTDAAALIIGVDPLGEEVAKSKPVLNLMCQSYTATLYAHIDAHRMRQVIEKDNFALEDARFQYRMLEAEESRIYVPKNLHSLRMTALYSQYPEVSDRTATALFDLDYQRFERWLENDQRNGFDHQYFDREELDRWLNAIDAQSI